MEAEKSLQTYEKSQIETKLGAAKQALAHAKTDFERIKIRDIARAAAIAASVLKHREVQVIASNLIIDAERAIAKANPPMSPQESGQLGGRGNIKGQFQEPTLSTNDIGNIRKAHTNLTDEQVSSLQQQAIETGKPLTRKDLISLSQDRPEPELAKLTDKTYNTIVITPPWNLDLLMPVDEPATQYEKMSLIDIDNIKLPVAEHSFVFCWTPEKLLPRIFNTFSHWGITYKFIMVWVRNKTLPAVRRRPYRQAEFIVVGMYGEPEFITTNFYDCFTGHAAEGSHYPTDFFDLLRKVTIEPRCFIYPDCQKEIEGFDLIIPTV